MNLFQFSNLPLDEELLTVLADYGSVRIERIISTGQVSDWYDQVESEFVALLTGEAKIEYDNGDSLTLVKGDTVVIPAHQRHRVAYTSSEPPCVWLCVFWK